MDRATSKKKKTTPINPPKKSGTQQGKHALMPFEYNRILQKWQMTNTPPKTEKNDTHRKWCLTKMAHLAKISQKLSAKG